MPEATAQPSPPRLRMFALATAVLALAFIVPLWNLVRFAVGDDLHSHIPLIPFISLYLVWLQRKQLPRDSAPARKPAVFFFAAGLGTAAWWRLAHPADEASLSLAMLAFLFLLTGAGCQFLGGALMRAAAFPFGLLVFTVPFPAFLRSWIETGLQHGSASVANWLFSLSGTPVFREGMNFQLPGMNLEVAPECSGIHSTLVLFITSLLAAQMFLRRPWNRAVLVLAVIPLALLRNGFRILVIGELCTRVGPEMINSPIHRHGGPLFFALSLLPFFLLLYLLRKSERPRTPRPPPATGN